MKRTIKALWNLGAFLFWGGLTVYIVMSLLGYLMYLAACGREVVDELVAPNEEFKAVVTYSSCGAFSRSYMLFSLKKVGENDWYFPIEYESEPFLLLKGGRHISKWHLTWENNNKLVISDLSFEQIYKMDQVKMRGENPTVRYELSTNE